MNRFRKLGFIDYNRRIQVHSRCSMWCCSINCPSTTPKSLPSYRLRKLHAFFDCQATHNLWRSQDLNERFSNEGWQVS
jgi:hypothetical protein